MNHLSRAFRHLSRHPGATGVALLTLALGIGGNTAIFSIVHGVLLKPLPYRQPTHLVRLFESNPARGTDRIPVSAPNFIDWMAHSTVFEGLAAHQEQRFTLTGLGDPRQVPAARVSSGLFPLLGVDPILGRHFTPADDRAGASPVVMLDHDFWKREFGGDTAVLGRMLTLDAGPHEVIGVLPPGFRFSSSAQVWVPAAFSPEELATRGARYLQVIGRLKPGIDQARANTEMNTIARRLGDLDDSNRGFGVSLVGLQEDLVGRSRKSLLLLLGAMGIVLLIACANIANLLLAQAATRQREFAVRAALGAGRRHLLRQLMAESLLLASIGGTLGILLASLLVPAFVAFGPSGIPRLQEIELSLPALGFSLALTLATGIVFGFTPLAGIRRPNLNEVLKDSPRGTTEGLRSHRLRSGLVVAESLLSLVLLVGAGLLLRSFVELQRVNPGFDPDSVLTGTVALPDRKYPSAEMQAMTLARCVEQLAALPGVQSAAAVFGLPFGGMDPRRSVVAEGAPAADGTQLPGARYRQVTPGYFRTLGIPLLHGRDFDGHDTRSSRPVVIVNQTFARTFFPGVPPREVLGRRINLRSGPNTWAEIVALAGDVRDGNLAHAPEPEILVPMAQECWGYATLVARTTFPPAALAPAARRAVLTVDPDQPLQDARPYTALLSDTLAQHRMRTLLLAAFALLALLLAGVGIFAVVAWSVSCRSREIDIRMALGAQTGNITRYEVARGMQPALVGFGLGIVAARLLSGILDDFLFAVKPADPLVFSCVTGLLAVVALLACWLPARRASRIDPLQALRAG